MTPIYDFVGREITPGCRVCYPMRRGSRMWLQTLRVRAIEFRDSVPILVGSNEMEQDTETKNIQNCIVVETAP